MDAGQAEIGGHDPAITGSLLNPVQGGARLPRAGLLIAMRAEVPARLPCPAGQEIASASVAGMTIGVVVSGVGRRKARAAASRLCDAINPTYLLSLGVGGGAGEGLHVGDLVIASEVSHGDEVYRMAASYVDAVMRCVSGRMVCQAGEVETVDRVALTSRGLRPTALAVDMEAFAVAQVAAERGLPLLVVKVVSDTLPKQANVAGMAGWLWGLRHNFQVAKGQLDLFARLYFTGE